MNKLINKELLYRIISLLIFVPMVILPLLYSNLASIIIYLIFVSIILNEIYEMKSKVKNLYMYDIYSLITVTAFFLFLLILITNKLSSLFLVYIIIVVWAFDTFSFLGGKIIGGIKLMPSISSGKTISGLVTGIIMTLLLSEYMNQIFGNILKISLFYSFYIITLSFAGDTLVSLLKRHASIKDSGIIMPGHGGLLDRFDSFIFVFFVIGTQYLLI